MPLPSPVVPEWALATATGKMDGSPFKASHCAVLLMGDQHSVAIGFNEDPVTETEENDFHSNSYANDTKNGQPRTLLKIMFCPGGGAATASASAVKSIDIGTNHAKSPLAGVQWVIDAGKDFKVEKLTGELKPGGVLAGKITGARDKTSFNLDFEVNLPANDAAAGMSCGK